MVEFSNRVPWTLQCHSNYIHCHIWSLNDSSRLRLVTSIFKWTFNNLFLRYSFIVEVAKVQRFVFALRKISNFHACLSIDAIKFLFNDNFSYLFLSLSTDALMVLKCDLLFWRERREERALPQLCSSSASNSFVNVLLFWCDRTMMCERQNTEVPGDWKWKICKMNYGG